MEIMTLLMILLKAEDGKMITNGFGGRKSDDWACVGVKMGLCSLHGLR